MKRPELARAGECVKALWASVHKLNEALPASDLVIMPDHVHLLPMVNYDKDPGFNPLVFIHWFMEESARMIAMDGGCAPDPPPGVGDVASDGFEARPPASASAVDAAFLF